MLHFLPILDVQWVSPELACRYVIFPETRINTDSQSSAFISDTLLHSDFPGFPVRIVSRKRFLEDSGGSGIIITNKKGVYLVFSKGIETSCGPLTRGRKQRLVKQKQNQL